MRINTEDIIGKRFRLLTVIRFLRIGLNKHKDRLRVRYIYECQCDCGNKTEINRSNLLCQAINATISCGCIQKERAVIGHDKQRGKPRPNVQKPNGHSILHGMYLTYKFGANKRQIVFNLSEVEFEKLTSKLCFYCGAEPTEKKKKREFTSRKLNGIDRLDNNLGYTVDNCVPCCKKCNYSKHIQSLEEWKAHLKRILSYCPLFKDNQDS